MSDFEDNNYNVLSWKFLNNFFSDQSKYRMFVKGVATENVDITLIPSQYFTEEFNKNGMDQLALEDELTEEILEENEEPVVNSVNKDSHQSVEHIDNTISKEVNDDKPTQESTRPKSKAIENKTINREIAAEAGLLDKGNLMTKVNQ